MWHKLEADITQLQAGVERLEKGQVELRDHILDFGRAVRDLIVIRL
jgi:exonuclease VII small subunit